MADKSPNRLNIDPMKFSAGRSDLHGGPTNISTHRNKTYGSCNTRKNHLVQQGDSLFDCIICMDSAKDPVLTRCGHLFCWPCIYLWLNHRTGTNRCPACKGEVTVTNVTPIYGQGGNNNDNNRTRVDNSGTKNIPRRPKARVIGRTARQDFNLMKELCIVIMLIFLAIVLMLGSIQMAGLISLLVRF